MVSNTKRFLLDKNMINSDSKDIKLSARDTKKVDSNVVTLPILSKSPKVGYAPKLSGEPVFENNHKVKIIPMRSKQHL